MTRSVVIAETLDVSKSDVISQVGRVIAAVDQRFAEANSAVIPAASTYPMIAERLQDRMEDLLNAMDQRDGDVQKELARLARCAVFAMAALSKQQCNGRG